MSGVSQAGGADLSAVNQNYIPVTGNTFDIGSPTNSLQYIYVGSGLRLLNDTPIEGRDFADANWIPLLKIDVNDDTILSSVDDTAFIVGGAEKWRIQEVAAISKFLFDEPDGYILPNTVDGADSSILWLLGGGDPNVNRGGAISIYGNEAVSNAGAVVLNTGNPGVGTTAKIIIQSVESKGIEFIEGSTLKWNIKEPVIGQSTLIFETNSGVIRGTTNSGALTINGGGGFGVGDGARAEIFGSTAGGAAGRFDIFGANVAGANVNLQTNHATTKIGMYHNAVEQWQVEGTGLIKVKNAAFETTGVNTPLLGSNFPGTNLATPDVWLTVIKSDGTKLGSPWWVIP